MTALPLCPLPQTHTRTHRRAPYLASSATPGSSPRGWPCGCSSAWGCRTRRVLSRRRGRGGRVWHTLRCSPGGGGERAYSWTDGNAVRGTAGPVGPLYTHTHTYCIPAGRHAGRTGLPHEGAAAWGARRARTPHSPRRHAGWVGNEAHTGAASRKCRGVSGAAGGWARPQGLAPTPPWKGEHHR